LLLQPTSAASKASVRTARLIIRSPRPGSYPRRASATSADVRRAATDRMCRSRSGTGRTPAEPLHRHAADVAGSRPGAGWCTLAPLRQPCNGPVTGARSRPRAAGTIRRRKSCAVTTATHATPRPPDEPQRDPAATQPKRPLCA
jgi:hypothetical protein